jgi:DnaJ-class molecular chaperone
MTKDYYKILGITEYDSTENIKAAYRKLVRKWHPDVAGNSDENVVRFKEINEAYEILSNKIKKEEYDRAKRFYSYAKSESNSTASNKESDNKQTQQNKQDNTTTDNLKNGFKFRWENFVSKQNKQKEEVKAPKRGNDIHSDIEISVFEAMSGATKTINMLQTIVCPKCEGRKFVNGTVCSHCKGKGETTTYKKFNVKVPAGVKNLSKIRLAGEGEKGCNGGNNGDLYITIHIKETKSYKTDGLNILKTVPITPYEAVLGANIKISTLQGNLNVKIAPNTRNGQKIRLAGCGIVQNNKIGDMIVTVEIQIPKNLSEAEISLYKKLAEISTGNIRDELYD